MVDNEENKFNRSRLMRLVPRLFFLLAACFIVAVPRAFAAEITLAWAPNQEEALAGYRLFHESRTSGAAGYGSPILAWQGCIQGKDYCPDLGATTDSIENSKPACTVSVVDGREYRFYVRAFDTSGNESADSEPACWPDPCDDLAPVLTSLSIQGPSLIDENSSTSFAATAVFSDGSTQPATNSSTWRENSSHASFSATTKALLKTSAVSSNSTVTITASYTFGDVTKMAQKAVTIRNVSGQTPVLTGLSISGDNLVYENSSASFLAEARFSDGSIQPATNGCIWQENSPHASFSANTKGLLTTSTVSSDSTVTITAGYTFGVVTKTVQKTVKIVNLSGTLRSLSISGASSMNEGEISTYTAKATYSDSITWTVTAAWTENSFYATINNCGVLKAASVSVNQTLVVRATYTDGGVTRTAQKTVTIFNRVPPDPPKLVSPLTEGDVSVTPELYTGSFFDGNGDPHVATTWQISTSGTDFSEKRLVFAADVYDQDLLEKLVVPQGILKEATTYYWRAKFYDSENASRWSDVVWFTTEYTGDDTNPENGIPDHQEVDMDMDLDGNGTSDLTQDGMKCVLSAGGDFQMGVKTGPNVATIESVESVDAETIRDTDGSPYDLPFGMVAFRARLADTADVTVTPQVTIYFSDPIPADASWYKYDSVNGWQPGELSTLWAISDDRGSVTLYIEDGGQGDADGVKNGVIVDPGGMGISYFSDTNPQPQNDAAGGGGGCFLSGTSVMSPWDTLDTWRPW
jgi:hypothetical protein